MPIPFGPNVVVAGRFRLNRQLGRGGMGSVWHATHLGLDVPCAVKFIEGEIAALPEAQARFEREAKAAAQLRSPNVVQILDHGVWEGLPYIAMELLEGEDLGKRLTRIGRMGPFEVVRIINQVSRALTRAHAAGVVHRDLKPDNIYLVRDEEREIAKVLDFGIAKASGSNAVSGSNTKTGAMLGTPYYMSPEQAQGTKAVDHRSDLWSLGVIVFQALTGKLPFESEALGDLLIKIIVSPIPNPSEFVNDLPPAFDRWWQKASQRDPALRWQSSKELAEGLGLVFGLTPGASVVEAPGRMSYGADAGFQGMPPAPTGPGAYAYGGGHVPAFAQTPGLHPQPAPFGLTPSQPGVPMPFGLTPSQPGVPMPYGASQPGVPTTGTPLSRSVAGTPEIPKQSRAALWVSLGLAGVMAVVAVVVGVAMASRSKHPIADIPAVSATAAPGASPTAANAAPPPATETLSPPAESSTGAAHPSAAVPPAANEPSAQAPKPAKPAWVAPPAQAPPAKAPPAAQPPATPAKPPHQSKPAVDLGI